MVAHYRRLALAGLAIGSTIVAMGGPLRAQRGAPSPAGLTDLVGTYRLKMDGELSLRISRAGADYLWSNRTGDSWTTPQKAEIITDAKRSEDERKGAVGILAQLDMKGVSADQSASLLRVAVGWQFRNFRSTTGYVLFTWFGPVNLYKNPLDSVAEATCANPCPRGLETQSCPDTGLLMTSDVTDGASVVSRLGAGAASKSARRAAVLLRARPVLKRMVKVPLDLLVRVVA